MSTVHVDAEKEQVLRAFTKGVAVASAVLWLRELSKIIVRVHDRALAPAGNP